MFRHLINDPKILEALDELKSIEIPQEHWDEVAKMFEEEAIKVEEFEKRIHVPIEWVATI